MPRKKNTQAFVSKADTREMRDYQVMASKYPPLPKEELIEVSRRFIEGRRASVTLMENEVIGAIVDGRWDTDMEREAVIEAFRDYVENEYAEGRMPKDVHDVVVRDILEMEDSYELFMETRNLDRATIRKLRRDEDAGNAALEAMVNHNLQFAMACVGKMMRRNRRAKLIGAKELIAVANVGLVLGARQYDPESNKAFTTYAAFHINGQLYEYLNREDGNMGIRAATLHEQKQIISIRQISESFKSRYGREPNVAEISSLTHISQDRVISRMSTPTIKTQSIFSKGKGEEGEDQEVFLPDLVMSDRDGVETEWVSQGKAEALASGIGGLDDLPWPQDAIIRMYIGLSADNGEERKAMTIKQIARELKLTPHSVERELNEGLRTLRASLSDAGLDDYVLLGGDYAGPADEGDDAPRRRIQRRPRPMPGDPAEDGPDAIELWQASASMEIDDDILAEIDDADTGEPFGDGKMTLDEASHMLDTMSAMDEDGYDMLGYDAEGYNRLGFDRRGMRKGSGTRISSLIEPYGDKGRYELVRRLFDAGQRTLPGVLEAMRLAGVMRPEMAWDENGGLMISGGGVRITRSQAGIVTFRRDLPPTDTIDATKAPES